MRYRTNFVSLIFDWINQGDLFPIQVCLRVHVKLSEIYIGNKFQSDGRGKQGDPAASAAREEGFERRPPGRKHQRVEADTQICGGGRPGHRQGLLRQFAWRLG